MQMRAAGLIEQREDRGPLCWRSASFTPNCYDASTGLFTDLQVEYMPTSVHAGHCDNLPICHYVLHALSYCEPGMQECWGAITADLRVHMLLNGEERMSSKKKRWTIACVYLREHVFPPRLRTDGLSLPSLIFLTPAELNSLENSKSSEWVSPKQRLNSLK